MGVKKKRESDGGRLVIERVALSRIKPAAYNPRKDLQPGDPEWADIAASIRDFGYVDPLIWNRRSGNLVGGHQRYKILVHEGVKSADVSVVDLDPAREKALNLRLNKSKGAWDQPGLARLLSDLQADGSIDMALTGFDAGEIERIVKEGDALVELLVPRGGEEEGEGEGGSGKAKEPHLFQVVVNCSSAGKQKKLHSFLTADGYECEMRSY